MPAISVTLDMNNGETEMLEWFPGPIAGRGGPCIVLEIDGCSTIHSLFKRYLKLGNVFRRPRTQSGFRLEEALGVITQS